MSNLAETIRRPEQTHSTETTAPSAGTFNPWEFLTDAIYPSLVRLLTGILIGALCLWMGAGIVNVVLDLRQSLSSGWAGVAERASLTPSSCWRCSRSSARFRLI